VPPTDEVGGEHLTVKRHCHLLSYGAGRMYTKVNANARRNLLTREHTLATRAGLLGRDAP
jgi:hypothetical protein